MKDVLKIMTCGSVDDGKSTLIGRLLYDAKMLFADQERALELESRICGDGEGPDYSLLLDGLSMEREQGITIDVAYRYFATRNRTCVVADSPGHEEYTRNMAVAASSSDLAIILVDACKGPVIQTKRHLMICSMMGIRDYVFALNKMDLVGYSRQVYEDIREELEELMAEVPHDSLAVIPLSALKGDNVTEASAAMSWYEGKSLLEYLDGVNETGCSEEGFVMPVQRIARGEFPPRSESGVSKNTDVRKEVDAPEGHAPGSGRAIQGTIASGAMEIGDQVRIYPAETTAGVSSIMVAGRPAASAEKAMAVSITLDGDVDVARGHVLTKDTELTRADMFRARLLWMDEQPLIEGRSYLMKLAFQNVIAGVMKISHVIDPDTGRHISAHKIEKNDIASVDIACHDSIVFDNFEKHQAMGRFILIDRMSNATAGCGTVTYPLRRATNISLQHLDISRQIRAENLGQKPFTLWFTGLSGSGKSVLANELEKQLVAMGKHTMLLDGDNVRLGINRDLGFNEYDRAENIRRVAEIAKLMNDAGIIVLTAFISPFEADRIAAREIIGEESFVEVYISTPLEECERRDAKGLYKKARSGDIPNFTGVGSPYEVPGAPDHMVDTTEKDPHEAVLEILETISNRGLI